MFHFSLCCWRWCRCLELQMREMQMDEYIWIWSRTKWKHQRTGQKWQLLHSGGAKVTLLFPPQPLHFQNGIWDCPSRTPGPTRWDQLWHLHVCVLTTSQAYSLPSSCSPDGQSSAQSVSVYGQEVPHYSSNSRRCDTCFASPETNRNNNNKGRCQWHVSLCCPRESSFPAHSQIYQPAHQRKGQLHLTGGWTVPPPSVVITNNPISLCLVESLLQSLGALWSQRDPAAGAGLASL